MATRARFCCGLAALTMSAVAHAGGWSVATLESWPGYALAGEPVELEFTLRGHGRVPVAGFAVDAVTIHAATGETLVFRARDLGDGRYAVTLELPGPGNWSWRLSGYGEHRMPDLPVLADAQSAATLEREPRDVGAELFLAKGCVTCHTGNIGRIEVTKSGGAMPLLSEPSQYSANPGFLRLWLAGPRAVTSRATMPDLNLDEDEIEALIAYLSR